MKDTERSRRWIKASCAMADHEVQFMRIIQYLATLDERLIAFDLHYLNLSDNDKEEFNNAMIFNESMMLSYFWVLSAYEIIRSIDQRTRNDNNCTVNIKSKVFEVKKQLERIRIPLAKLEASRRNPNDYYFPLAGINTRLGVTWEVADGIWISRKELSDLILDLLEQLRKAKEDG